jgi:hypothetical protein
MDQKRTKKRTRKLRGAGGSGGVLGKTRTMSETEKYYFYDVDFWSHPPVRGSICTPPDPSSGTDPLAFTKTQEAGNTVEPMLRESDLQSCGGSRTAEIIRKR